MNPNIFPNQLIAMGVLPINDTPARFAIGPPDGLTSNSWRIWSTKHGDVYISCRDNFTEAKVSLHTSGRWLMGYTSQAIEKSPKILSNIENRAWEVWDKPEELIPNGIAAFQLIFLGSELAICPEKRIGKKWRDVIYIESQPSEKLIAVTVFITKEDIYLNHESEPSFCLASYKLLAGYYTKFIVHSEAINGFDKIIENSVVKALKSTQENGVEIPDEAYFYFYGKRSNGIRYISGARVKKNLK